MTLAIASDKWQATSDKRQVTSDKQQATSNKQQATSNKQQAEDTTRAKDELYRDNTISWFFEEENSLIIFIIYKYHSSTNQEPTKYIQQTTLSKKQHCNGIWTHSRRNSREAKAWRCSCPKMNPRTKHIATKYHHFRCAVKQGFLKITRVDTSEQLADILTKAVPLPILRTLRPGIIGWLSMFKRKHQPKRKAEEFTWACFLAEIGWNELVLRFVWAAPSYQTIYYRAFFLEFLKACNFCNSSPWRRKGKERVHFAP